MSGESTENRREFAAEIRRLRETARMTQAQLSSLSKVSRRTIIRWESAEASPWIPELQSVLKSLQVSPQCERELLERLDTNRSQQAGVHADSSLRPAFIKMARRRAKLRQAELAEMMDCDASTINRWETGSKLPRNEEASRLWSLLKLPCQEIAEFETWRAPAAFQSEVEFHEHLAGIAWPWDRDGFCLFDLRMLRLSAFLSSKECPDRSWNGRAAVIYASYLVGSGRFDEAREQVEWVHGAYSADEIGASPTSIAGSLIFARALIGSRTGRAIRSALGVLDWLEKKPLDWRNLALRYDTYAEALSLR
jgi:transcriptional regulator with XRE-family HTH domain